MAGEKNKSIYIYADWVGLGAPQLMGVLSAKMVRGKEIFSFEYDKEWLRSDNVMTLDPDLSLFQGFQYLREEKKNFGLFLDSSPDRWGRVLMKRRENILAKKENRHVKTLFESDFLMGVYDPLRMGALRFKLTPEGVFLDNSNKHVPPWASIRKLQHASLEYEKGPEQDDADSSQWLDLLYSPGSSLGGARPKANIRDVDGALWIAKFPSRNDNRNVGAWEMAANVLAQKSGIKCAVGKIEKFNSSYHTFITKRFDRTEKEVRIHFASAMTLLGYMDGANAEDDGVSYLELVAFIVRHGANVEEDLKELFRRIVFSICISNTDDHLRNHGFLLGKKGWTLSPAFDINPNPDGARLKLNIDLNDNSLDLNLALSVAKDFRLGNEEAKFEIKRITKIVSGWETIAKVHGISFSEQSLMAKAFSNYIPLREE